jgi:two-component system, cell cycle response regulator CpdR
MENRGARTLVVEDEAAVRHFIHRALATRGHDVVEAENGLEALQVAHRDPPCDLVITDQIMPMLSGLELIARLAMERYPARYLLISGYSACAELPAGLACLVKPFTIRKLLDTVDVLLGEATLVELEHSWKLARKEWMGAATELTEIICDIPSQIPHSDGSLRIERAAMKRDAAYNRYKEALHRYRQALRSCGIGWTAV